MSVQHNRDFRARPTSFSHSELLHHAYLADACYWGKNATLRVLDCKALPYEKVNAQGALGHESCNACNKYI